MGNWRKSGGGFLDGVSGTIVGYKFDSKEWPPKRKGGDPYTTLSVELNILPDGADAPVQQFLPAGFLNDGHTISDDGLTIESENGTPIGGDTEFAKFIDSMEAVDGFNNSPFAEADYCNFEAMVNQRFTFKKVIDKEATEKFGKRVAKKGAHKGKEFNRDYLAVSTYLGEADKKAAKGAKANASKSNAKSSSSSKSKANDIDETAKSVLLGILADAKDNTIAKGTLSSAIVKYCLANDLNDQREDIRKALTDEFIAGVEGVEVDAKKKTIALTE